MGCKDTSKLIVATSANVQFPIEEIVIQFEQESGLEVDLVVSSSGKLCSQIEQGAPYDIFISANLDYPQYLNSKGLTKADPKIYAYGQLVLWTCKNIEPNIDLLTSDKIEHIAIANPKHAPYGVATVEVLERLGIYNEIESKLVYAESVSQCNHLISSEAVDVGFTSLSAVSNDEMKSTGNWIEVSSDLHSPIEQAVVILNKTENISESRKFFDFMFSEQAKEIFVKYGYQIPENE